MMKATSVLTYFLLLISLFAFESCNRHVGQTQEQMFNDNKYTNKKKSKRGTYSNSKKIAKNPPSVEYAKGYIADDNPKKTAKKMNKEMERRKRKADKERAKHNKKVHQKIKTTKSKKTEE